MSETTEATGHVCTNGNKWRNWPAALCSMCTPNSGDDHFAARPTPAVPERGEAPATSGPMCVRCGRTKYWHPDASCHLYVARPEGEDARREALAAAVHPTEENR